MALVSSLTKHIVFVLGLPGAGKTTLSGFLQRDAGYLVLSGGEELRRAVDGVAADPVIAREAEQYVSTGTVAPSEFLFPMFRRRFAMEPSCKIILDGFPRTLEHFAAIPELLQIVQCDPADVLVVHLALSESQARQRLMTRYRCPRCGSTMQIAFCESCRVRAIRRSDDVTIDSLQSRIRAYNAETGKVIRRCRRSYHFLEIEGTLSPSQIAEVVLETVRTPIYGTCN
jgi:adenylate kinase family enzyme